MSIHIGAKKEEISKTVLMPGDPLRAKMIAETFLEDYKLVTEVRGMYGYTGMYKGKEITVMGSGMGIPSMGIYAYELYNFYDVENIIRIGSMGSISKNLKLREIVLAKSSFTKSDFGRNLTGKKSNLAIPNESLNSLILEVSKKENINVKLEDVACTECFDAYTEDPSLYFKDLPKDLNVVGCEMESYALFKTAEYLNKKAAAMFTVVDVNYSEEKLSSKEREEDLKSMIKVALESAIKL